MHESPSADESAGAPHTGIGLTIRILLLFVVGPGLILLLVKWLAGA